MTKAIASGLLTHYGLPSTTLATLWRVTRKDGQVFGFTDHDRDIRYPVASGLVYKARTGIDPSQISASAALNIDNLDLKGYFDSDALTQADLEAGLWDGAEVQIFRINWANTSQGAESTFRGVMGEFSSRSGLYTAEARSLTDHLNKVVTRIFLPSCPYTLGDSRCTVDLAALTVSGTVSAVDSNREFNSDVTGIDDAYSWGIVTWLTGGNQDRQMEVKKFLSDSPGSSIILQLPMVSDIEIGDTFTISPGCRKSREECRDRFNNIVNFGGFPDVPGLDEMIRPGGTGNVS